MWPEITFAGGEESLIKRVLPRRGVAVVYGKPASFKSFVVGHMALCVALGWVWAGRHVYQAPVVYIAAEGAASSTATSVPTCPTARACGR
jgi:hypothetical protein